jgi:hypothetical protein
MIIGFITKKTNIPILSLSRYLLSSYGFRQIDLQLPSIQVANTFSRSQGYQPSENDVTQWHQLLAQSVDPDYRINYMNHIISILRDKHSDIVIDNVDTYEEASEIKRNGGKIILVSDCNCSCRDADYLIREENLPHIYREIDSIMKRYRIERS